MTDPLITRVEPLRPRGLRVHIHLDRGEPLEVTLEALERSLLGVGDQLPPTQRHALLDSDADIRIRDAALNLISYRARTRTELERRLRQKGFRPARIGPCLDRLGEKGFIDDGAVAAAFIRDRLRHRPRGKARLSSELHAKGVDRGLAREAIDRVFQDEKVSDEQLAHDVAEQWMSRQNESVLQALGSDERSPERDKARRRLHAFLSRRGFRGQALTQATSEVLASARRRVGPKRD